MKNLITMSLRFHIDEIRDDNSTDISQPQLFCYLSCRTKVGLQDCFRRVFFLALPRESTGIDVDRHKSLCRFNYNVPTQFKGNLPLESPLDFFPNPILVEKGFLSFV
jgi:hypothetical protein